MPRFLRIITGDAKAFTNGDANANASWSCTGFENRQLKDKYPICPEGSQVVRTVRLPELLGRAEHRQRQPPHPCGVRTGSARRPRANATWVRWLALSVFARPSSSGRRTSAPPDCPRGQIGYLSLSWRFSKPVQLQEALALASPLVNAFASPVMIRRKRGIAGDPADGGADELQRHLGRCLDLTDVLVPPPPPSASTSASFCPFCSRSTGQ